MLDVANCGVPPPPPPPPPPADCYGDHKTQARCDGASGCAWCTSGAVPPACNSLAEARSLPPAVFSCDKVVRGETWSPRGLAATSLVL